MHSVALAGYAEEKYKTILLILISREDGLFKVELFVPLCHFFLAIVDFFSTRCVLHKTGLPSVQAVLNPIKSSQRVGNKNVWFPEYRHSQNILYGGLIIHCLIIQISLLFVVYVRQNEIKVATENHRLALPHRCNWWPGSVCSRHVIYYMQSITITIILQFFYYHYYYSLWVIILNTITLPLLLLQLLFVTNSKEITSYTAIIYFSYTFYNNKHQII